MKAVKATFIAVIIFSALAISSCDDEETLAPDAVYTGIFYRTTPFSRFSSSEVTLELSGGKFAGTTSEQYYPAICSGSFTRDHKKIVFQNECVFTANFDWTFILDGEYEISEDEDDLFFIQEISPNTFNVFQFSKK